MYHDNNKQSYNLMGDFMKKNKCLIIGISIILVGVVVQPCIANVQSKEEINTEPKDYLIQTLLDILNVEDVKEIFEQSHTKFIDSSFNLRFVFQKLLCRCPRVLFSTFFTKPRLTNDYLDFIYHNGCEIIKIIGEKDALKITESIKFERPETIKKIKNKINENPEINAKILTLKKMNKNSKTDLPYPKHPIICATLTIIFVPLLIASMFFFKLFRNSNDLFPLLEEFFLLFFELSFSFYFTFMIFFGCIEWPPLL